MIAMIVTAGFIICTACLLSFILCRLFPHNGIVPYVPCILYALGGVYFLMLGGVFRGDMQAQLRLWAITMLCTAFASFGVAAWIQSKASA